MSLFDEWKGRLQLPTIPNRKQRIGKNYIFQKVLDKLVVNARISNDQLSGHDLIRTNLEPPFDQFLLRRKGARKIAVDTPILHANGIDNFDEINENTEFEWESLGSLNTYCAEPSEVLSSWKNKFKFILEDEKAGILGLRKPQIGSLHAISAHFSVGTKFDAATIVLPTGTGKTETMLAAQVYGRLEKTLVIVPSDTLRTQIAEKFRSLGILPLVEAIPRETMGPKVGIIKKGIATIEEAREIIKFSNVIIATTHIFQASAPDAVQFLYEACTDLIVDEAHHITAKTWNTIRSNFEHKRIIQFTATPFRRDGKKIDGKIIFNYKLGDAQRAGYYRPINLRSVEEFGDQESRDLSIAKKAIEILRQDIDVGKFDHVLMARAKSKDKAEVILKLYNELAPEFKPVLVISGPGRKTLNQQALDSILDRENSGSRIIVCVDMLGEGYDLPNLKIAALHENHKSLAVTLQFIGRITRKSDSTGEASVITNIADPDAEEKLANLYAEGADWDFLIRRLSEDRIEKEMQLQELVYSLKEHGNLHDQISLWNLRPSLSSQIYKTSCDNWYPLNYRNVLPTNAESWHSISEDSNLLVVVVYRRIPVRWGNFQDLIEHEYDLLLVWWDQPNGALFIYSSDYDGLRVEQVSKEITGGKSDLLSGPQIFNILNNVEMPLAKSLGSSKIGAISFTSYFGPNVTEGLASIEKAESELNNIACLGYENGDRVVWGGAKRKGKVWQQKSGSISEWVNWCALTWEKVSSEDDGHSNITKDFLRPNRLLELHHEPAIAAQWGEHIQMTISDKLSICFEDVEIPLYLVDIDVFETEENDAIGLRIFCEEFTSDYKLEISNELEGGYLYSKLTGPDVYIKRQGRPPIEFNEYVVVDPPIVRYCDGTHSYNCYHIPVNLEAGTLSLDNLETWDWSGIELNRESMHKEASTDTIQYRTFENIVDEYDIIVNDDGPGEAADLVAFKDKDDNTIQVSLFHCKGATGGKISDNITNFYTVCGQAQKSISVKHGGFPRLYYDLKRRNELWIKGGHTRFLKGDIKSLSYFKEKARKAKIEFEITIVQPGASSTTLGAGALTLLATTELFIKKTTDANFRIIVSP